MTSLSQHHSVLKILSFPIVLWSSFLFTMGFPCGSGNKKICLQYRRPVSDSLEQEMATHCSIHEWKIPWTEAPAKFMNPLVNMLGLQIYSVPFYFLTHTHMHMCIKCYSVSIY